MALALSPSGTLSPKPRAEACSASNSQDKSDETKKELLKQFKAMQQAKGKKFHRKRRHSTTDDASSAGHKGMPAKHRRQPSGFNRRGYAGDIILPTKFLLGGNIRDPLNLNSMLDENINQAANAVTPSSSPLPPRSSKINIVIPSDMTDPLGLNFSQDVENSEENTAVHPSCKQEGKFNMKKRKRRRKSYFEKVSHSESKEEFPSEKLSVKPTDADLSDMKENLKNSDSKSAKNKKANSLLLGIESDGRLTSTEQSQSALSIAVPQLSAVVDPIVSPVIPQDVHKNSGIFSPKSRKRKSLSQASGKVLFSDVSASNKAEANAGDSSVEQTSRCEVARLIETARLQSNSRSVELPKINTNIVQRNHKLHAVAHKPKPSYAKFQYGNYTKYYGYRNPQKFHDIRMGCLKKEWFKDKDVLDVGCNAGHLTLLVARDFSPRKIVGVDIDGGLISNARRNIRHYATAETRPPSSKGGEYPPSMPSMYGPIIAPPLETGKDDPAKFPNNVVFLKGNYVPEKDEVLHCQEPEYDVIMCMSVSKWVHLNWGDEGLVRTFKRMYKQLRPGGKLILEPQEWKSYGKKKKLTETIFSNYNSIQLRPAAFPRLLVEDVGFGEVEYLQPAHSVKGFQRPIQLYCKPE